MNRLNSVKWSEIETMLRERLDAAPHGTKGELAARLGMTPTHLSQLISGKRPMTREVAERVAAEYGLTLDYQARQQDGQSE